MDLSRTRHALLLLEVPFFTSDPSWIFSLLFYFLQWVVLFFRTFLGICFFPVKSYSLRAFLLHNCRHCWHSPALYHDMAGCDKKSNKLTFKTKRELEIKIYIYIPCFVYLARNCPNPYTAREKNFNCSFKHQDNIIVHYILCRCSYVLD